MYGVAIENAVQTTDSTSYGQTGVYVYATHGEVYNETASSSGSYTSFQNQEIIGIAVDLDASPRTFKFYNNNTLQGTTNLSTNFNVDLLPIFVLGGAQNAFVNFGQDSSFAGQKTAQGNTDGNGIGDFYYAPPSGHLALCSSNISDDTIPIGPNSDTRGIDHFGILTYTSDGNGVNIVSGGNDNNGTAIGGEINFKPDWVWIKRRNGAAGHMLQDSSRGSTKRLRSDNTDQEITTSTAVTSFDTNGFTLGTEGGVNTNGGTYVAWNWKANGGTTSTISVDSVTSGVPSIASTVQANQTAGFSIVLYTGTGANATVGHGLGAAPRWIIMKRRDSAQNWVVYHEEVGNDRELLLNESDGQTNSNSVYFQNTSPSTSVFSLGSDNYANASSGTYVAYCFAEVEGYSKFGSYVGNGDPDGTFVYLGFRPAFLIYKRYDSSGNWLIDDNVTQSFNPDSNYLVADTADQEGDTTTNTAGHVFDMLSNGFKMRNTNSARNASGGLFVYMAFADIPFKFANAR
jgi:hypothetical protein